MSWASDVWSRMCDSERYDFKQAFVKGSRGLRSRMIGKRDVAQKLLPIVSALEDVGMESSGDEWIGKLYELTSELRK